MRMFYKEEDVSLLCTQHRFKIEGLHCCRKESAIHLDLYKVYSRKVRYLLCLDEVNSVYQSHTDGTLRPQTCTFPRQHLASFMKVTMPLTPLYSPSFITPFCSILCSAFKTPFGRILCSSTGLD